MSIFQVIFSADFILAMASYCLTIGPALLLFDWLHRRLEHQALQWPWDHIGMPLLRALLILMFILMVYPGLFALDNAPTLGELFSANDGRLTQAVNILFLVTLLIPLVPVVGDWEELVLPAQAMTASALLFSWLAEWKGINEVSYLPGTGSIIFLLVLAILTHWLAVNLAASVGEMLDEKFHVKDSGHLVSRALVLVMQSPVIVIYSLSLGKQLA